MKKRVVLHTDIDKRGSDSGEHPGNVTQVNIPYHPPFFGMVNEEINEISFLGYRYMCL
jgi:hypothetical protein